MADVEQRAEAEAAHKGLSGGAAKAYVGGVFNRIRQAHSRGTQPGKGARHLQRRARVEARQEAKNRIARHEQLGALEKLRMRMRTRQEEPRKPAQTSAPSEKRGHADGSGIPQLQPGYQPSARELRGNVSLVHGPEEAQGTIKPLQPAPTPAQAAATGQASAIEREKERMRAVGADGFVAETDPRVMEELRRTGEFVNATRGLESRPTGRRNHAQPDTLASVPVAPRTSPLRRHAPLVPIKQLPGFQLDATRRLDPYFIREYYGDKQLPRALEMQTDKNLREAVEVVEEKTGKKYSGPRTLTAMRKWILANM